MALEVFLMEMVWDSLVMLIQLSFSKFVFYLVMVQTSAKIGTILILFLQGVQEEEFLIIISDLVRGMLEEVLEMLVAGFFNGVYIRGFNSPFATLLVILILEIITCQVVLDIRVI